MTYIKLFDSDWDDIKHKVTKEDRKKLKEISKLPPNRQEIRLWCISKDREQKLNQLGL